MIKSIKYIIKELIIDSLSKIIPCYPLKLQSLIEGLITFFPGCSELLTKSTRGTDSARYCYAVWMRHDIKSRKFRSHDFIDTVMELGPGDSLGTGISAMLAGANNYIALDVVKHANLARNQKIFKDLIHLFSTCSKIPDSNEFPKVNPFLENYDFPVWVARQPAKLFKNKIEIIANALSCRYSVDSHLIYLSPNMAQKKIPHDTIDFIFSQAVLEHVEDLKFAYQNCFNWLCPGGIMSHAIDFKSHGTSLEWNGHWTYSKCLWRLIKGRRPYLINREPWSRHLYMIKETGFVIKLVERDRLESTLTRKQLSHEYAYLDDNDLTTAGVYVVAQKPFSS